MAACEAVGGELDAAMGFACAFEMIHTYSLIHDDLPCMDDDDFRRGRPTNHKVYGEAIATLAGDALLTDAFMVLARIDAKQRRARSRARCDRGTSEAAGSAGMVGGQVIDLLGEGKSKTIEAAGISARQENRRAVPGVGPRRCATGRRNAGADRSLDAYAHALGLAFQVVDDLLDVQGSTEQMGKRTQKDSARGKATYPALLGVEQSRAIARELERRAHRALDNFGASADPLRHLATFVVERRL